VDAQISSSSGKKVGVALEPRIRPVGDRRVAALKGLGIGWGISLVTAPLPPIHWVTVPFFFFFGF